MSYLKIYWSLICYRIPTVATRMEYFVTCLLGMIVSYSILAIDLGIASLFPVMYPDLGIGVLQTAFAVWMLIPGWRYASSRLRDTGRYTWKTLLWVLVPIIGFFVIIWALTRPTDEKQSSKKDWNKVHSGIEIDPQWKLNHHSLVLRWTKEGRLERVPLGD